MRRFVLPFVILVVGLAVAFVPAAAASIREPMVVGTSPTPLGGPGTRVAAMTVGPDGQIWVAGTKLSAAGTFEGLAGHLDATTSLVAIGQPQPVKAITLAPDGSVWLAESSLVKIEPDGTETILPRPGGPGRSFAPPTDILATSDGLIWFTQESSGEIGWMKPDGTARFGLRLDLGQAPRDIVLGPDGALWFTEPDAGAIARTPGGDPATYPLKRAGAQPNQIAVGPDGNLWFTESGAGRIGRVTPAGEVTEFSLPNSDLAEEIGPIVAGPDGDLWFGTDHGIGSVSPSGRVGQLYCLSATCEEGADALALGSEGSLWVAAGSVSGASVGPVAIPSPTAAAEERTKAKGASLAEVQINCRGGAAGQACVGSVQLNAGGRHIGSRAFKLRTGEERWTSVRLNATGLKLLARKPKLRGRALIKSAGGAGQTSSIILHRPPGSARRG